MHTNCSQRSLERGYRIFVTKMCKGGRERYGSTMNFYFPKSQQCIETVTLTGEFRLMCKHVIQCRCIVGTGGSGTVVLLLLLQPVWGSSRRAMQVMWMLAGHTEPASASQRGKLDIDTRHQRLLTPPHISSHLLTPLPVAGSVGKLLFSRRMQLSAGICWFGARWVLAGCRDEGLKG